ncbi:cytochrome b/b6 domain-containing protein [Mangrovibrevibacter kandeliae]|uniref:cytochrome b/b6 domain-containing protein n=1 Tax=Mangrovibrevibacter kandeliae TaxID=2968473 RepID=UPI002117556C|nr:cytochrome b/b6 domain-containing protein [Aurantimonas sp. CSK15Z-1]MCQ8782463.1 cytochrome b/b6 domain-containing protein [Aurantimonas sp. CSK15Z-1]
MTTLREGEPQDDGQDLRPTGRLVYRQALTTRLAHWLWAAALFFLLLSGLQIFMARPNLYIGQQSGFGFDNAVLSIDAERQGPRIVGYVDLLGHRFDTTGWLGAIAEDGQLQPRAFPSWMTIPGYRDLATGRVVHFFFAWMLVATLLFWFVASLINGHARRDLVPTRRELGGIGADIVRHLKLRFAHDGRYNILQKLSYAAVLFLLLPLMIATGLTMSPGINAFAPWLLELFGGRQSARTIHFAGMLLLVLFFIVHLVMVLLAGPLNELRSIVTGWYRTDPEAS